MKSEVVTYAMGELTAEGVLVYDEKVSAQAAGGADGAELAWPHRSRDRACEAGSRRSLCGVCRRHVRAGHAPGRFQRSRGAGQSAARERAEQRQRIRSAYNDDARQSGQANLIDHRRAAIGFCFGGGNVLELARDGADVAAAVSIHGDLKTAEAAKPGAIKAALLVTHGAPDPVVPKADRDAFEQEMEAAGAKWQMLVFSGVLHAYTDEGVHIPGIAAWNEPATRTTYALTQRFIADAFAGSL